MVVCLRLVGFFFRKCFDFFCHLVPSCIFLVYFLEPIGSFLVNILLFINKKKPILRKLLKVKLS